MIKTTCPKDRTLHYNDEINIGKTIRCRTCGATLTIEPEDPNPPVEIEPEHVAEKAVASVSPEPRAAPKTEGARPQRMSPGIRILIGGGGGAVAIILIVAFWLNTAPPASSEKKSSDQNRATGEASPEPSSGVAAPVQTKHASNAKPVRAKRSLEENPPGALPPCAQGREPVRLKTGERIRPDIGTSGPSNIQVLNAGAVDAAVKLVDNVTGKPSRFVYIQAGHSFTIDGIETGAYLLQFQFGSNWIPECHEFLRDADYFEFTAPFVFLDDRIRYFNVTLSPVLGAKTRTRRIDRERFLKGDQDTGLSP